MQNTCPSRSTPAPAQRRSWPASAWLLVAGLAVPPAGWAQSPAPAALASVTKPTAPGHPQPAAAEMSSQLQAWMAGRQGLSPQQVLVQPLDARMAVRSCDSGWQFDQPFAQPETVRVRCAQPVWQAYVRVALPAAHPVTPPAQATRAAAPAPELRAVVVTTALLQRGARIQPDQVEVVDRDVRLLGGIPVERVEDVLNAEVVRDIGAGAVLRSSDIRPAWLVRKGQLVQMNWSPSPGFAISARLEALENGRMGEPVRLKNRESGRIISGVVSGAGTVSGL